MAATSTAPDLSGIEILGSTKPGYAEILTPEALAFVAELERRFDPERRRLLDIRARRQALIDAGEKPDFLPETKLIRDGNWSVAPLPKDLLDRRVEITGPVERKMIINALNSGAKVFMADFEDATTPTWDNLLQGQINLRDAVDRTIGFADPQSGKVYTLADKTAVLKVRPRGWHLDEKHVKIDGQFISGSLFDFGLFFFHNAVKLVERGSGPYFYLPKIESHFEARLWREVFDLSEQALKLPYGTIKATVLIETITAAFEMEEILYELRDHAAGLNCGRWDYIFSFIKRFHKDPASVLPDRAEVTMATHFLSTYSQLAIRTCHKRNVPCIGGMAAFIPVKDDPAANEAAFARVRADKEREAANGHDGTWVAHPGLVPVALEVFNGHIDKDNQIRRKREDVHVTAADLLKVPQGAKTEAGLRNNVAVGLGYIATWLGGTGCVPLFNLMEDAATAEISRAQVWQWRYHGVVLDCGRTVDTALVRGVIAEELARWKERSGADAGATSRFEEAAELFRSLVESDSFVDFLTVPAYDKLVAEGH